jgi:hypothetical protein
MHNLKDFWFYAGKKPGYRLVLYTDSIADKKMRGSPGNRVFIDTGTGERIDKGCQTRTEARTFKRRKR